MWITGSSVCGLVRGLSFQAIHGLLEMSEQMEVRQSLCLLGGVIHWAAHKLKDFRYEPTDKVVDLAGDEFNDLGFGLPQREMDPRHAPNRRGRTLKMTTLVVVGGRVSSPRARQSGVWTLEE